MPRENTNKWVKAARDVDVDPAGFRQMILRDNSCAPAATAAPRDHAFWVALVALAFVIVDVWWFTRSRSSVKQKPNTVVELRS